MRTESFKQKLISVENGEKISDIFRQQFTKPAPMAIDIMEMGHQLFQDTTGLSSYQDAVYLASAIRWGSERMHTYDQDDLFYLSGKFHCRIGNVLTICYPDSSTDGELFEHVNQNPN